MKVLLHFWILPNEGDTNLPSGHPSVSLFRSIYRFVVVSAIFTTEESVVVFVYLSEMKKQYCLAIKNGYLNYLAVHKKITEKKKIAKYKEFFKIKIKLNCHAKNIA